MNADRLSMDVASSSPLIAQHRGLSAIAVFACGLCGSTCRIFAGFALLVWGTALAAVGSPIEVGVAWQGKSQMTERFVAGLVDAVALTDGRVRLDIRPDLADLAALEAAIRDFEQSAKAIVVLRSAGAAYLARRGSSLPLFFGAVSNPQLLGLVGDASSNCNCTGISYHVPARAKLEIFQQVFPAFTAGLLLLEANHPGSEVDAAESLVASLELGIDLRVMRCDSLAELHSAVASALPQEVIILGSQALVMDNAQTILSAAGERMVFSYAEHPVDQGALVGFAAEDYLMGQDLADMLHLHLIGGHAVATIPFRINQEPRIRLNLPALQRYKDRLAPAFFNLARSHALMERMFGDAPGGFGLVRNWIVEEANDYVLELTGYSRREVIGRSVEFLYPDSDEYSRVGEALSTQWAGEASRSIETAWVHKDGRIIEVLLSVAPLDPKDLSFGFIFTAQDITEGNAAAAELKSRTRWFVFGLAVLVIVLFALVARLSLLLTALRSAQSHLTESREHLAATLRSIGDGVISCDRSGAVVSLNRAAEAMTGWTTAEAAGKPMETVFVIVDARSREPVANPIAHALATGEVVELANHTLLIARDGSELQIADSCAPIRDEAAEVCGAVLVFRDVTKEYLRRDELLRAKAIAEQQNSIIHAVFDNLEDFFYYKDRDSRILGGNAAWARHHGFDSINQMIGKTDMGIHPPEFGERLYAMEQIQMQTGVTNRIMEEQVQADGSVKYIESIKCAMRNSVGEVIGLAGISRNVTQQVLNERKLRESQQAAEAANRAKGDFLANMSHEIRTPMNGVIGMVELLLETGLSEEQLEYAQIVKTSAESLMTVINDILSFAKIEAGKIDLEIVPLDLPQLVADFVELMRVRAEEKGLQLRYSIASGVPDELHGDPVRLRQILLNLVGNAIKFTDVGEVSIRVEVEPVKPGECSCVFTVTDTGIGIAADKLPDLFNRFHQVDTSMTRKYGGTGLGLAISRQLAELMGGEITVESEHGKGSRFCLRVPLKCPRSETAAQPSSTHEMPLHSPDAGEAHGNAQVLLVEDDLVNLMVARTWLEKFGHVVTVAADGYEALEKFQPGVYDLIFMDVQMPQMDGLECTRRIRAREKDMLARGDAVVATPIIAMTAHAIQGYRNSCLKAGMDDYIAKPVKREQLEMVLRRWLQRPA